MSLAVLGLVGFVGGYLMRDQPTLAKVAWLAFIVFVMLCDWGDHRLIRELEEENAALQDQLDQAWDDLARETHADNER